MKNEALNEINVLTAQLGSLDSKIEKLKVEVTNEKIESAVQIDVGFNVVREQANIVSLVQTLVLLVLSRKLLTPCRNLPFGGRATRDSRDACSTKGIRAESPPTFIRGKTSEKPERCGLQTLSVKGSGVVFTHGEGISTPRVRHKGRQPLIKCANMT